MGDSLHRMIEIVDENYLHGVEEGGSTEYFIGRRHWPGRPVHKFFLLRHQHFAVCILKR